MDCIKHLIVPHIDEISKHENPMAALSFKMYDIIESFLNDIINLDW